MNILTHLLLNTLVIIAPILLYQVFWIDRIRQTDENRNRLVVAILCSVTALLCVSYPYVMESGLRIDLRLIPIAICYFVAGVKPTLVTAAILLLYRFGVDETGFIPALLIMILVLVFLALFERKRGTVIRSMPPMIAGVIGISMSLIASIVAIIYHIVAKHPIHSESVLNLLAYSLVQTGTAVLTMLAIRQLVQHINLRGQAQHHEKMNVLGDLAVSFADEIRSPMTVSRGFVQLMKQNDLPEDKRMVYNQLVLEELDRAQSIINDYLSFARPQMDALQLVDAKQLVVKAIRSLEDYAGLRNVSIEIELQDRMMISANSEKFTQSIIHLCKNGIEAMPGGGKLRVIGTHQNQTVSIDIIDQGVGMSTDEVNRLGTPYYFTRGKGTGLGMMVAYRSIQNIHGRIDVTTEPGRGTCFTIVLPALQPSSYH